MSDPKHISPSQSAQSAYESATYDASVRILHNPILSAQDILLLDKYYILYWEARYLHTSIELDRYGIKWIRREGIRYQVHFNLPTSFDYLQKNPDHQVRVSFRRIKGAISGIALISQIKGEQNVQSD